MVTYAGDDRAIHDDDDQAGFFGDNAQLAMKKLTMSQETRTYQLDWPLFVFVLCMGL